MTRDDHAMTPQDNPDFERYLAAYEAWQQCSAAHTAAVRRFAQGERAAHQELPRLLSRCNESYRKFLDEAAAIAAWEPGKAPPAPPPADGIVRH